MVKINLFDNYHIISDKNNWILAKQDGDRMDYIGYFSTLAYCIESFFRLKLRLSNANSIHSFIEYHKSLVTALNKALQPLEIEVQVKK